MHPAHLARRLEAAQQRIVAAAAQLAAQQQIDAAQVAALSARHWDTQIQAMQRLEAVAEIMEAALLAPAATEAQAVSKQAKGKP